MKGGALSPRTYKMPIYTCEKCLRIFERKSGFDAHKAKKKDCGETTALSHPVVNTVHMVPVTVTASASVTAAVTASAAVDSTKTTLAELIVACKAAGVKGYSGKNKAALIALLEGHRAPAPENVLTLVGEDTIPTERTPGTQIRYIDLFSGLGAFHTAFNTRSDAFKCVLACDINEGARRIYKANYGLEPEQDIRDLDLEKMPEFEVLCAGFPCFAAGTQVLTQEGYKPIETVELTDRLLTHTGTFQRILNLQQKTGTPTLRVLRVAGRSNPIRCTEEHPFYARTKDGEPEWLPARSLTANHSVGIPVNTKDDLWEGYEKEVVEFGESIPEWVQDAPAAFVEKYLTDFHKANSIRRISDRIALEVQRLYLKLGLLCSVEGAELDADIAFFDGGYAWFKVLRNEPRDGGYQTVYNFEVEHDNSYCVENVIVHNCQPFSIAGNGEGFKDTVKGNLFYDILKIVDKKTPPMCILENVKNLKTHDKGNTYKTIVAELVKRGYLVTSKVINASEYGSPQARHRIFIVATKGKPFTIPEGTGATTHVRSILDPKITADELNRAKYTLQEKDNADKEVRVGKPHILYDLFPIPSEKKKAAIAAAKEAAKAAAKAKATTNTLDEGEDGEDIPKGGRQGERVYSVDAVGITVCASSGGPGAKTGLYKVGDAIRRLSVGETLKMFGFPETFVFPETSDEDCLFYLGNSIVVDVPKAFVPVVEAWFS